MTNTPMSIAPFYQGWDAYNQHLIDVIAPLTTEQLGMSVAPHLRPVGMNATHIVGVRYGWMYYVLGECHDLLAPLQSWDDQPMHSADEIVEGLKLTWRALDDILNRYTADTLQELVEDEGEDGKMYKITRQWVLWHLIEHDLHHGGELSYTLGREGVAGINL